MSQSPPTLPPKTPEHSTGQEINQRPPPPQQQVTQVDIPEEIQSLPKDQLIKLIQSVDVLKGYLITLNEKNLQDNTVVLDGIVKDIESFIQKLQQLQKSKDDLNKQLLSLQALTSEWNSREVDMYSSLQKFGSKNLYSLLRTSVLESKKLTESISQSFIQDSLEKHDEASIQNFIKNYKAERKLYYLRTEKLHRFNEERVGGLL
ncbi:hypothetical protein BN7_4625 [Wickerhamomyces ciferrii]|uniref:VPS37 C-terminal domain-containing protein n=1 Tax=Wickerhamomyces ciferrii (strain ATCC 14091 / BCRC 22168 / CBS 111 / JCM 3599 / NBRC 0793 / NRRL Y-1031 F-60-10) TaxID=1206466 RepID=K0KSM6_WICCF|nr:uncharacterized protein BN7_4625 [Wickerhamomyces ciferrii]CCH45047.1 hypothetical protein BN7_4625 [Wickerhamomyces ciferrii]